MQKLRSTFKRSRTPTGAEMKSQSSLEVPKQIRSASFDEIQLEAKRQDEARERDRSGMRTTATDFRPVSFLSSSSSSSCSSARSQQDAGAIGRLATLRVPQLQSGQRSKSFDACSSGSNYNEQGDLERVGIVNAPTIQVSGCYHCACAEEYKRLCGQRNEARESSTGDYQDDGDEELYRVYSPEIRVTLLDVDKDAALVPSVSDGRYDRQRRRSIASPKLSRQEALTCYPAELPYVVGTREQEREREEEEEEEEEQEEDAEAEEEEEDDDDDDDDADANEEEEEEETEVGEEKTRKEIRSKLVVRDIFLTVPELKRDRAASVDSCFNNNKTDKSDNQDFLAVPQQGARSKSVDIVLPTDAHTRYTALLPANESSPLRRGEKEDEPSGSQRELRTTPDWSNDATNEEHYWVPTATSGDFCLSHNCLKRGPRLKCSACRGVVHRDCIGLLKVTCKPTFRDVGVRQYREQTTTHHHWIHRRSLKGKCTHCSKSLQSKLSFTSKDTVALSCSWCKTAYHNRDPCFDVQKFRDNCEFGIHASIIVPPSWIVKLPRKGSFKSSLRKSPKKKKSPASAAASVSIPRKKCREKDDKEQDRLWAVKPIPTAAARPLLVFINPKSGGNQGAKLLQKFQWFLNPRQVFDLTEGGPKMGLELFKNVPNLRVLACGGDGTVGWILSILDQINVTPPPAVGVLPLGTGNDLARTLGWGGGYTDEPISKILTNVGESETTLLDRWRLTVSKNVDAPNDDDGGGGGGGGKGKENLPLNVVNNYFSLGVDAHIALEFHEAREAHPEKFNSRLRNKMFYGQMGGKDLLRRKWKDLSEFVTLECDGKDLTPKLKEHRVHAIVFLNIASYGGGTHPWGGGSGGAKEPSTDDSLIEVVGLTTYQLPLLQAGGHGTCVAQCKEAKLVTTRTIPMQVDGEACRLLPSVISLNWLNQATMLAKRRNTGKPQEIVGTKLERLKLPLKKITMSDYETYHSDRDKLMTTAVACLQGPLDLEATMDLESLRTMLANEHSMDFCCFLDSCTAERFFRIDRAQEQLHYVTDITAEALYVLDDTVSTQTSYDPGSSATNSEPDAARPSSSDERAKEEPLSEVIIGGRTSIKLRSNEKTCRKEECSQRNWKENTEEPVSRESTYHLDYETRVSTESSKPSTSKSSVGPTMTHGHHSVEQHSTRFSFVSPRDRLFGLSSEVHTFNRGLLEKTCDGILKAAKIGDLRALKELHEQGYSLLSIDASGQTALHLASRHGHKDIVRYLIASAPTDILNIVDNDKGQTALHKAALQKRRSICCMLIAGGANLTVRDRHGNTPHQLAYNAEDRDLAAYLHSKYGQSHRIITKVNPDVAVVGQEQFQLMTESTSGVL